MINVSIAGYDLDIERNTTLVPVVGSMRVFVARENIKSFSRQIALADDEANRRLLTRMLREQEANLEAARASMRN